MRFRLDSSRRKAHISLLLISNRRDTIMPKKRTIDPQQIDNIAQNMFHALPLLKKRLLHMDLVQSEYGIPLSHAISDTR